MVHKSHRTDGAPSGQARTSPTGGERIAKALARAGVASRRDVERLIEAGRVALNGQVLTTPAVKVEPGDILTVDGKVVSDAEPARLFRYHKPVGLVTTHKDPHERPTVFENLPEGLPRLISVGRLDLNSEGLLLLTNDGGLARGLELPATGVMRRYRARARGRITQDKLDRLKDGITVDGVHYGAIDATLDKAKDGPQGANLWITVTLSEGKNREVRKVLEALGLTVNRLIRLAYGPFALGTLMPGEIEEVGPRVIREQLADHIAPENMPTGDRPQFAKVARGGVGFRRGGPVQVERADLSREDRPARYSPPNRRRGGGEPAPGTSRARPAAGKSADAAPKKEYKAGWAKAKPPKPGGAPHVGPKTRAAKAAGKAVGPRSEGNRPDGRRSDAPRSGASRPGGPKAGASRPYAPRGAGPKSAAARVASSPMIDAERPDHRVGAPRTDAVRPAPPAPAGLRAAKAAAARHAPKGPAKAANRDGPPTGAERRVNFKAGPKAGGPKRSGPPGGAPRGGKPAGRGPAGPRGGGRPGGKPRG